MEDLSKLCIHTLTTKPWDIEYAAEQYARAGVGGISVWQQYLNGRNPVQIGKMLSDYGLEVPALVRGGFFPSTDRSKRDLAVEENKKMLETAAALGADMLVLVCGADPGQALETSRSQIREGIEQLITLASECRVKLAIEPLHPMYADTRSAVNTLEQANDMAEAIQSDWVGVAIDVYHLWWDPHLETEIIRCGKNNNIFAFHICDWMSPTADMLNDRGLMGEGCIPVRTIRSWVENAGFNGFNEVEIFSDRLWASDQHQFLEKIIHAYKHNS
ncbi:MAG: sugar phosphate isomerase/epimerase [Cyclobacteriaceae bacterium]|nr:sugar phosphate isomerase/epimerase [Cyclobacteriaceae bacterium]